MSTCPPTFSGLPAEILDLIIDKCSLDSKRNLRDVSERCRARIDNRTKCLQKYINDRVPDNAIFITVFSHELSKIAVPAGSNPAGPSRLDKLKALKERFKEFRPHNLRPGSRHSYTPEQVKALRDMLPTDAIELEIIKIALDSLNKISQ